MHRAYQPITPAGNKLLQQKWDDKYYNEHRDLVRTAKPMVDTRAPRTYVHMHMKLRKLQLEEERLATIERDNRILLEKMSHIMRTKGRVDNRNEYEHHSLNREKRQRELMRITKENQEILKRIMKREPEYDHAKWQREWEKNEQFMDNIARYPKGWYDEWKGEEEKRRRAKPPRSGQSPGRTGRTSQISGRTSQVSGRLSQYSGRSSRISGRSSAMSCQSSVSQAPRKGPSRQQKSRETSRQSTRRSSEQTPRKKSRTKSERKESTQSEDRKEDADQSKDAKQTDEPEKPKEEEGAAGGEEEPKKEVEEEEE
ncbi:trichohyalin-like isoform X2 [Branchiostoma floridae]|uniref:Trichohyalin-like isoform X2 n=1 Tax=Branchiostoma floridae TaxID=7739 RepID=A0A9J7N5G5_BRAFL|nr:trichohyalin-like isoform X2 [Branchiostoma floridae]